MSILLSNLTTPNNAPAGTIVGVLTAYDPSGNAIPCNFTLTKNSSGFFAISGKNLVTARASLLVGIYAVRVHAVGTTTNFIGNANFNITVAAAVPAPPPPPPPPPPPSGTNAEWTLTQASVSGTTVADASGNGNAATVINGPLTFGAMGANFNGQQYVDSKLSVTSSALTVSVWFNATTLSNGNPRLVANSHPDADAKGFQLIFTSGGASGFFDVGNGTAEGRASWSKQLVAGTWYHYAGVYDGATVSAYLNGVQVATAAFSGGAIAAGSGPDINIARNPSYSGDYFTGAISDVRIYQRALSLAEIQALYQAVTPPPPAAPTPIAIALSRASATTPDNAPAGTVLATATVTMSDGSQFAGSLTSSDTSGFFAISGLNLVTARALTPADDGTHSTTITASQGGQAVSMQMSI